MANPKTHDLVTIEQFGDTARFVKGEVMDETGDNRLANVYVAKSLFPEGQPLPNRIKLVAEYD